MTESEEEREEKEAKVILGNVHICITCNFLQRTGDRYFCAHGEVLRDFTSTCSDWMAYKGEPAA